MTDLDFRNNQAGSRGGAVCAHGRSLLELVRATFLGNTAGTEGGALAAGSAASIDLVASTLAANGAPAGGHLWGDAGAGLQLSRTVVALATEGGAAAGGTTATTSCVDAFGNVGGDFVGPLAPGATDPTSFSADPLFCDLAGENVGLQEGSPCAVGPCGQVGAEGILCTGPVGVASDTWARVKARYR